ncbi:MAG: type IV pilus biogenesis/stability protein PilW [Pseudomonadota bacterium]
MKRLIFCLLLLSGCANISAPSPGITPAPQATGDGLRSARVHTELAANYYGRRQYDVALEELGIALRAFPSYGQAYNMLGLVYMDLKENTKAGQSFEQALKINPNDSDANNNYGWFLCQRGDPAKSIAYFAAAQRDPLYTTPERSLINAGICSRKINDLVGAEKYFRDALALQPNESQALYNMADISYQRGDFEESRKYLIRYMRAEVPTLDALWLAVRTERRLSDRTAEASFAAQLCRRFPDARECLAVKMGSDR